MIVDRPTEPALPDVRHPRHNDILEWMRTLEDALIDHGVELDERLARGSAELSEVESAIRAITG